MLDSVADIPSEIPPEMVRAAVERISVSDIFQPSPQLVAFLRFVVEAVLRGQSDRVKGYTIGVEVLRRDVTFDPQIDPIVRVEATRLRRALERYYSGPGANDDVIIDLPRGSYVPVFRRRADSCVEQPAETFLKPPAVEPKRNRWTRHRTRLAASLLLLLLLAGAAASIVLLRRGGMPAPNTENLSPGNGMPTLVVENFEVTGNPGPDQLSSKELTERLRDTLSRFDLINVAATAPPGVNRAFDYQLRESIDYLPDNQASLHFSLSDVRDGLLVWTQTFDRLSVGDDFAIIEDSIVGEVALVLVSPFGVIPSRGLAKDLSAGLGDPRYQCLLLTVDSFRSYNHDEHRDARACLEHLTSLDRAFAEGFSYLAILYEYEWVYGLGPDADNAALLDRALSLAQRGIELKPNTARAWHALGGILIERRDFAPGLEAFEKAVALNPFDPTIVDGYGGRLITLGEIERGITILQQSKCPSDKRPSWYHFYLFLANYMLGKLPEAAHEAATMTSNGYPHGLFARALTAALQGDNDRARSTWSSLVALRSAWRDNPRAELERFIFAPAIVDKFMSDLARTGLYTAK